MAGWRTTTNIPAPTRLASEERTVPWGPALLCENGGRASSKRVQWANSTEPESAIRRQPPGTTIFVLRVSELRRGEARFQNALSPASRKSMRHWKI